MAAHEAGSDDGREPDLIDDILELHKTDPQFMPETDLMLFVLGPYIRRSRYFSKYQCVHALCLAETSRSAATGAG